MSESVKNTNVWEEDFLTEFYQSEEVAYDSPLKKAAYSLLPDKVLRVIFRRRNSDDSSLDMSSDQMISVEETVSLVEDEQPVGDLFEVDTELWKTREKKALSKRTKVSLFLLLVAIPVTVLIGMYFFRHAHYGIDQNILQKIFGSRIYYFLSLMITLYALIPFFMVFEGRKPQARELVVLATMVALNCAGRAAFFMVPDFKPIYAITIISGIAFGGEAGFLVGAMSMVVSNFLFGQGPWTPWQMLALGMIGFLSGVLYQIGLLSTERLPLSIFGFLMAFIVYGGIMNPGAMFMSIGQPDWKTLVAYLISGVPVDLVKGASTFLFLWFGGRPMLEKLQRIKIKYGLIS